MSYHLNVRFTVCAAALSVAAQSVAAPSAHAQQAPVQLPGLVIQGATLEKPPVAQQRAATPSDEDDAPAPKAKPKASQLATPAVASVAPTIATDDGQGSIDRLAAGIPASEVGTSVTVITARDIQQQQSRTMADVLNAQPGLTVTTTGSVGGVTDVRIRGSDSRDTRVLIDGVEANTTKDASFDFSNLSPDDIERIEIIRGPMSALYGSGALGGVINIETKAARGPLSLQVRAEGGSFGTTDFAGRLAAGGDSGFISLTAQERKTQGFVVAPGGTIREGTQLQTYGLRAGFNLSPTVKLDTTLRYTDKHAGFPDFGADFLTPFTLKPFQTADDARNTLIERSVLAGVRLSWDSFGGALSQQLKTNYTNDVSGNRFESTPQTPGDFIAINHTRDEGSRANYGYSATYRIPQIPGVLRQSVTGQLEKQAETFKPYSDFDTSFGNFNGDNISRTRNQLAGAAEWRATFGERLSVTAGGRRDINDTFANFNTWRTSASLDWKEWALRPHASLGTGVKLPGMFDQFGANTINYEANPNLKPETSRGYDYGVEKKFLDGQLLADITYFASNLQGKIDGNGFDTKTFKSFAENVSGVSERRGVEFSAKYQITQALFVGAAYTFTNATKPDGTPEYRRVPNGYRFDTRYLFDEGRGTISLSAINNSRTPDIGFSNDGMFKQSQVDLQGYWVVQAAASYKIQPNVEVYARLENALGAKYQEVYGYNTAGFGAYAGVKFKFDDVLGAGKK